MFVVILFKFIFKVMRKLIVDDVFLVEFFDVELDLDFIKSFE